jgi:hypothetical protein
MRPALGRKAFLLLFCGIAAFPLPAQAARKAVVTWNASSDAAANPTLAYNVYKLAGACPASGTAGFAKVNTSPVSALTFTDSGIGVGPVCYYVTATLNGAESIPSNTAGGTVGPSTVVITVTVN